MSAFLRMRSAIEVADSASDRPATSAPAPAEQAGRDGKSGDRRGGEQKLRDAEPEISRRIASSRDNPIRARSGTAA